MIFSGRDEEQRNSVKSAITSIDGGKIYQVNAVAEEILLKQLGQFGRSNVDMNIAVRRVTTN